MGYGLNQLPIRSTLDGRHELRGIAEITTESSRTALPFFEQHGYRLIEAQQVERLGVVIENFKMVKSLEDD